MRWRDWPSNRDSFGRLRLEILRCLDLEEEAKLPESLSKGAKSHEEFKHAA
jgi:hypothetical protein